jgi:hypothetical protein
MASELSIHFMKVAKLRYMVAAQGIFILLPDESLYD